MKYVVYRVNHALGEFLGVVVYQEGEDPSEIADVEWGVRAARHIADHGALAQPDLPVILARCEECWPA